MDPKQLWETPTVSLEQAKVLQAEGIGGMLRLAPFEMQVRRLDGQEATIQLTSAGAWIIVTGAEEDYILLTEQADRTLPDGRHPFEIPSGGMIFGGMVDIRNLPSGSLPPDFLSRRYPGGEIYFDPPEGVDRNEISRIVLVPIDKVIDGSSQVLKMSSHYWAHKPGLLAFLASIRVEVE